MNLPVYTRKDLDKCPSIDTVLSLSSIISEQCQIICFGLDLDNTASTPINITYLQSMADSVQYFYIITECLEYLEKTKHKSTLIIVSEEQAIDFIPEISSQENILQVYILNQNLGSASSHQQPPQWTEDYGKVSFIQGCVNRVLMLVDATRLTNKYIHLVSVDLFSEMTGNSFSSHPFVLVLHREFLSDQTFR